MKRKGSQRICTKEHNKQQVLDNIPKLSTYEYICVQQMSTEQAITLILFLYIQYQGETVTSLVPWVPHQTSFGQRPLTTIVIDRHSAKGGELRHNARMALRPQ